MSVLMDQLLLHRYRPDIPVFVWDVIPPVHYTSKKETGILIVTNAIKERLLRLYPVVPVIQWVIQAPAV